MFLIVMGVSGSGKTTVGKALAEQLGWEFYDADDFHSTINIKKMARGIPLTDEDREPWLRSLRELILSRIKAGLPGILACSALKENYRQILLISPMVKLIYLRGNYSLVLSRLANRSGHFMNLELLQSQFDTLIEPIDALTVDIANSIEDIIKTIVSGLFQY